MPEPTDADLIRLAEENPVAFRRAIERSLCQDSLIDFVRAFWRELEPTIELKIGWALEAIAEHLEAVSNNEITNLLINVPPGMMKSLMVSVFWPSWEWGPRGRPDLRYIFASYAEGLARRDNMRARDLLRSDKFLDYFGDRFSITRLQKDTEQEYHTDAKGFRFSTGVGGKLTGYRGDRLVVDDPHSVSGGDSDADRNTAVRWFAETLYNRVNDVKTAKRVVIMQRVHELDVSGHILDTLGHRWEKLILPMRFEEDRRCRTSIGFVDPRKEEGELLFPERFPPDELDELEEGMMSSDGEYAVAGQMQQRPVPRGGGMFKVDNISYVDAAPAGGTPVRGWDFAGSVKKDSPFTAGVKGKLVRGVLYIEDVVRFRKKIYDAETEVVNICKIDGGRVRQSMPQDPGQSGLSQKTNLATRLMGLNFFFSPESGSKEDRAIPFASYVNVGKVVFVKGPWNAAFKAEMSTFPRGAYKDQVDAASRMFSELQRVNLTSSGGARPETVRTDDDE